MYLPHLLYILGGLILVLAYDYYQLKSLTALKSNIGFYVFGVLLAVGIALIISKQDIQGILISFLVICLARIKPLFSKIKGNDQA